MRALLLTELETARIWLSIARDLRDATLIRQAEQWIADIQQHLTEV